MIGKQEYEASRHEDQYTKNRARRQLGRERVRALALARLLERIIGAGGYAKVYGRMADGSIAVEHWAPSDQMPVSRWRLTLEGEVIDDNRWMD